MLLGNVMRRAASLLVEMPPEPIDTNVQSSDVPDLDDIDLDLPPEARLSSEGSGTPSPVPTAKTIDQIVREADGPNLDQVKVDPGAAHAALTRDGGQVDFPAVYRAAKLPEAAFGAEQMLETLASLPPELPLETRRATVKAMLGTLGKTTGASPESIVADASRKLAALESFAAFMEKRTGETVANAQSEIAELEAQIEARKTAIQTAKNEGARLFASCEAESERLDEVLAFFSVDANAARPTSTAPAPGGNPVHLQPAPPTQRP